MFRANLSVPSSRFETVRPALPLKMRRNENWTEFYSLRLPILNTTTQNCPVSHTLVLAIASVPMACNLRVCTYYTDSFNTAERNSLHGTPWKYTIRTASPSHYTSIYDHPSECCLDSARAGAFENYVYLTASKKLWLPYILETMEEIHDVSRK